MRDQLEVKRLQNKSLRELNDFYRELVGDLVQKYADELEETMFLEELRRREKLLNYRRVQRLEKLIRNYKDQRLLLHLQYEFPVLRDRVNLVMLILMQRGCSSEVMQEFLQISNENLRQRKCRVKRNLLQEGGEKYGTHLCLHELIGLIIEDVKRVIKKE